MDKNICKKKNEDESQVISARLNKQLIRKLKFAALKNERTLKKEIEIRLKHSLLNHKVLIEENRIKEKKLEAS